MANHNPGSVHPSFCDSIRYSFLSVGGQTLVETEVSSLVKLAFAFWEKEKEKGTCNNSTEMVTLDDLGLAFLSHLDTQRGQWQMPMGLQAPT